VSRRAGFTDAGVADVDRGGDVLVGAVRHGLGAEAGRVRGDRGLFDEVGDRTGAGDETDTVRPVGVSPMRTGTTGQTASPMASKPRAGGLSRGRVSAALTAARRRVHYGIARRTPAARALHGIAVRA
jgi:hypothetical protein